MKPRRYNRIASILFTLIASLLTTACVVLFPEDENLLEVTPQKFVPCSNGANPCGMVMATPADADRFMVEMSNRIFRELLPDYDNISQQERTERIARFAIQEVVNHGYCAQAEVPEKLRAIASWEGRGERAMYVVCKP